MAGPPLPPTITPNMGWDALAREQELERQRQTAEILRQLLPGMTPEVPPAVGSVMTAEPTAGESPLIKMFDPEKLGVPAPAPMTDASKALPKGPKPAPMPEPSGWRNVPAESAGSEPTSGEATAAPTTDKVDIDRALGILRQFESSNRNIRGPLVEYKNKKGEVIKQDYPYGFYQIMGSNIPSWTKEVLGKSMTPQEFMADPEAQHAVAKAKFGQFANQYSLQDAYAIWASGRPLSQSANNKDIVFGTKVSDTVAARMAAYHGKASTKMADVPNMLEMPRPTVGDVASPSPFYQDAPPTGQDEFNTRYQEALGFLKSPEWKAAALQMAIAAIQPRVPGQTVFGHLANAVGQGAEAAGRASAIAEEQRRAGVKEQLQQDELGLKRQEVEGRQKLQEGQLKLQEGQLSIQQATLSRMTEQNQIAWKRLDLDRDRMDKEMARIDAQIKAAEGRERVSLLQNSAKMRTDLIANAQKRLELLHPEKDKVEVDALKGEIARNQSELERLASEYEAARKAITPGGAEPTKPAEPPVVEMPIKTEQMLTWARENPEKMQEATTTGTMIGGKKVKFKLTEDQQQQLEDAGRVIPRASGTMGERIQKNVQEGRGILGVGAPPDILSGGDKAGQIKQAGGLSDEEWDRLSSTEKAKRRDQLDKLLPNTAPVDAPTWKAILEAPQARKAAVAVYGEKRVAQAEKDLADMAPRRGKETKRQDALKKALE